MATEHPLEPSDGEFRFYWADHEEFEYAHGPFDTREEALANALQMAEDEVYGPEPGSTVFITLADKRVCKPQTFNIEQVLEDFAEANEDCFTEDGWDGLTGDYAAAEADLQAMLQDAVRAWEVKHRDKIKTFMFGTMKDETEHPIPELTPAEMEARVYARIERQFGFTREQLLAQPELVESARRQIELLATTQAENAAEKTTG
jgi:hypothetical protein